MNTILAWLATYTVHSSLLLGVAALLTATWIRRDAWRETVWKAALLGGILTTSLQPVLGVHPLGGQWKLPETIAWSAARWSAVGSEHELKEPAGVTGESPKNVSDWPRRPERTLEPAAGLRSGPHPSGPPSWPGVLVSVWGALAVVGLCRLLHRQVRLQGLLRGRREVTDQSILGMLAQLRRYAGFWRLVRVTATPRCSTPFAIGVSEICVPDRLFDNLTRDEQRCALAHELAHLARRDPLWQLLAGAIQAVFFFQPLNRLAARRLRETAEYLSDDWAVSMTGSATGLARCLAAVASWVTPEMEKVPRGSMAMAEGGSPLLRRVERLLGPRVAAMTPPGRARAFATVAIIAVAVGAAPGVVARGPGWLAEEALLESARGTRIYRTPDSRQPLAKRQAWSAGEAARRGHHDYWIAYESRSVLPPGRAYGTDSRKQAGDLPRAPLQGIVFRSERDLSSLGDGPDLVVLLRVHADPHAGMSVTRLVGRTPNLEVDLEGLPVYWLSAAEDGESVALLSALGHRAADARVYEKLVDVIAVHRSPAVVVPCLLDLADGDNVTDVRAAAALGLAWHPSRTVIDRLLQIALTDRSDDVRDHATEALGRGGTAEGMAALDQIISSPTARLDTRVDAVEALGNFRRPDILPKLVGIAFGSYNRRMQDEAVETVASLGLPEVPPVLKQVAFEHPDPSVRGEAMGSLAETGRRGDLEALFHVAMTDQDPKVQRQATRKLADFRLADAAPLLRRLVWEHESEAIRRDAVELIGAMPETVGLPLLEEVVARHPDELVRQQAVTAIARYGGEQSLSFLREVARNGSSGATRRQALDLLDHGVPAAASSEEQR